MIIKSLLLIDVHQGLNRECTVTVHQVEIITDEVSLIFMINSHHNFGIKVMVSLGIFQALLESSFTFIFVQHMNSIF